ncbi:MAG: NUDIX hydrolase [Gammaproteobacteria bacterium]|jgi:8-oxo-dGTP pyrophosphatase MutT (NUDIX family)
MTFKPHVTVSSVIERDRQFLLVEERVRGRTVLNNPAGHLEAGESLLDAVVRETLEETAWDFRPEALTGIYLWRSPTSHATFLRAGFCGRLVHHHADRELDTDILRTVWMTRAEIEAAGAHLRSPLVLRSIDDYLAGTRHPLDLLQHITDD